MTKKSLLRYLTNAESGMLFCFILSVLAFTSCDHRDPQAEFEVLSETVFSNPSAGEQAAQGYIDYFSNKKNARINEAYEIRDLYRTMEGFFSNSFSSYADFLENGRELNEEMSRCYYSGVRQTWMSLYGKERERLLGPLMDSINESSFEAYFKSQVRELSENEFNIWKIESIDPVSMSTPEPVKDGTAKKCNGEYRVHLRGGVVGLLTEEALIEIEGVIGLDETGNVYFTRTGYQFLKKPALQ